MPARAPLPLDRFRQAFETMVSAPLPAGLPFPDVVYGHEHFITDGAPFDRNWLLGGVGTAFDVPRPAFFAGFWGYGVNSYAFYYVSVTRSHRVHLRLGFGGAYDDPVRDRAELCAALAGTAELLQQFDALGLRYACLVASMGSSAYQFVSRAHTRAPVPACVRPCLDERASELDHFPVRG
jgi:hypothetical protein